MPEVDVFFNAALTAFSIGAAASLGSIGRPAQARIIAFTAALLGAMLLTAASVIAIAHGSTTIWYLPSGVPLFTWTVRLDPLSAFFSLALGILAIAVSIFSFGYIRDWEGRRNIGVLGFFYNILLLSLAVVF